MSRILLVCSFGMSTSLLLEAMRQAAEKRGLGVTIEAVGTGEVRNIVPSYSVILLGPQVRYAEVSMKKFGKPVGIIDSFVYATAQGDKALDQALALMEGSLPSSDNPV